MFNITEIVDIRLRTFFPNDGQIFMGMAYLLMAIIGVIGNVFTILVMVFYKRLNNSCTPYLISVAVSDLLMTGLILPVVGINAVTGKVFIPKFLCKWVSVVYHITLSSSWSGLAMVSAIRCMAIWTNHKCFLLRWTKGLIAAIWSLPIVLIAYSMQDTFGSEEHIRTGYICWFICGVEEMFRDNPVIASSDMVFWLSGLFNFVPLAIMVISYSMICYKMQVSKRALTSSGGKAFNKHKSEVRFTKMIGIIFGGYILFTFIPGIVIVVRSSHPILLHRDFTDEDLDSLGSQIIHYGDMWMFVFLFVPFVTNPFIYVISNPVYRKAYQECLNNNCGRNTRANQTPKALLQLERMERFN